MMSDVVKTLMRQGVGIAQMNCPEFSLHGNPLPPRIRDGYNISEFRQLCREIATRTYDLMECFEEKGRDAKIRIAAIGGVETPRTVGLSG